MDVWVKRDIANALAAALQAAQLTACALGAAPKRSQEYQAGYVAALNVVATFFGVAPFQPMDCRNAYLEDARGDYE